jgi:MFS transporter, DHA1 family, tetracycline resistance protein
VLANTLRFGWDSRLNGIALGVAGLASAIVQGLLVRRLVSFLGERRAAMTGALVAMTGYFCQGIAPWPEFVFLGIALQALGAFGGAAVQAMVSASADPERQGETMGALSSLQGLTAILSPIVATLLFSTFTRQGAVVVFPGAPFLASAVACLVGAWAVFGLRPSVAPNVGGEARVEVE